MSKSSRRRGAGEAPFSLPVGHPLGEVGDEWLPGAPVRARDDDRPASAATAGGRPPSRNLAYGDYWVEKDGADCGGRKAERHA
ncbi:hypothetical protein [Streptomyces sp. H39-S7]|uniref:hypothetical protein n=1 Tax=Streptomyces sp. H39-S7 TaxID=3004357 RepID=UPI0022AE71C1|nr:hypothetical protein [Streptomyces sp. H39-S7]MCZ4124702.1 hypothetical protein [Streptomyces sp. H39-S7]